MRQQLGKQKGATLVQYALLAVIIVVVCITAVQYLGGVMGFTSLAETCALKCPGSAIPGGKGGDVPCACYKVCPPEGGKVFCPENGGEITCGTLQQETDYVKQNCN